MYSLKNYFRSTHWKIQAWYGAFLVLILIGILLLAINSLQKKTYYEIDQALINKVPSFGSVITANMELDYIKKKHLEFKTGKEKHNKIHIITAWQIANNKQGQYVNLDEDIDLKKYRPYPQKKLNQIKEEMHHSDEHYVLYNPDRTILEQSSNAPLEVFVPPIKKPKIHITKSWSRGHYRESYKYLLHGYAIVIGVNLKNSPLYKEYNKTVSGYFILALVLYLISFFGGAIIINRALLPIRKISHEVKEITLSNISHRLITHQYSQEFLPLTTSLNETFDSLENTFNQQRAFTQNASHELKTPVAVILSQAEYSLEKPRNQAHYINALEVCQRNAEQMKQLIEQLMLFTQHDPTHDIEKIATIYLDALIHQCLTEIRPLADKKNINIKTNLIPCPIKAPKKLARSIIDNLLSNAIHYNRNGGLVSISCNTNSQQTQLIVSDTGIGIEKSDINNIFNRFYRVDKTRPSSSSSNGLGLAIVKEITPLLNATIEVKSTLGEGSCFTVVFNH